MNTIKITGVSDELLAQLDARVAESGAASRSEYLRRLLTDRLAVGGERMDLERLFARARLGRANLAAESMRRDVIYRPDDE